MIKQEELISKIKKHAETIRLWDDQATSLFQDAIVDTISNTVSVRENGEIFVATGDIPAMWLRDSTFQILPYLEMADSIPEITSLVHGVLKQQLRYINHDPYANAFNKEPTNNHYSQDVSNVQISPLVWERKFEIDSLCAPLFLAYQLYKHTGYSEHLKEDYWVTVELVLDTFITEQHHESSDYIFKRTNCPPSDTLSHEGRGEPISYTGMVWSAFRPSDDACKYGYFIPGNCFILVVLGQLLELLPEHHSPRLKRKIKKLQEEITEGIQTYGLVSSEKNLYYAYEVDGLGKQLFMDDANVPSLLSLPFLGYCGAEDPLYTKTREKCLSEENPYYYVGQYLYGIGSPHTPPRYAWPIALAMEGLTSNDIDKMKKQIETIVATDGGTGQCHEGIDVDNPNNYTREWFSWSNMTYCQLVFRYLKFSQNK